jgi:hypothetical protein
LVQVEFASNSIPDEAIKELEVKLEKDANDHGSRHALALALFARQVHTCPTPAKCIMHLRGSCSGMWSAQNSYVQTQIHACMQLLWYTSRMRVVKVEDCGSESERADGGSESERADCGSESERADCGSESERADCGSEVIVG